MPSVQVVDMAGNKVSELVLSDTLFGIKPNKTVMHLAVRNYLANQRLGTQSTLTRSEVSGGGKKPWRQKGTGHARQGSTRAPQWHHGGIALGPKPRDYSYSINKKVKRLALQSAFSDKVLDSALVVLDSLDLPEFKTRAVVDMLNAVGAGKKALIVLAENDKKQVKSSANIPGVKTAQVNTVNTYDILNVDTLIIVRDAVGKLEEVYA
ncbi:MAG: 50S ribosomal protein L4 [Oscillospiraceae bacterium]|jgi:large subunit ribosomal protein L4|nr:50S ribosomal protein L4 [Oscillospiraceae bacterium]